DFIQIKSNDLSSRLNEGRENIASLGKIETARNRGSGMRTEARVKPIYIERNPNFFRKRGDDFLGNLRPRSSFDFSALIGAVKKSLNPIFLALRIFDFFFANIANADLHELP